MIEERQHLALETIQKFYEEKGFWPTQREAHVFLVEELDVLEKAERTEAITDGYRFLGRRMGELVRNPDDEYPDLLEKQEQRKHEYLEENFPGADSGRKGEPHRITVQGEVENREDVSGSEESETEYVFDPEEQVESRSEESEKEKQQKLLYDKGKVVG